MANNRKLDEIALGDIILCEPITRKGKASLSRLGLSTDDISPAYFFDKLRVPSKYGERSEYKPEAVKHIPYNNQLYYQYTVDSIQFEELKNRLKRFNARFSSNAPDEYPLLLLGVAGNGKSIEINRRIQEIATGELECCKIYIDLENAFTELTYGITYQCPSKTPIWFFCIKLLDGIMNYIRQCHSLCPIIFENFNNIFARENLADDNYKRLFEIIGSYSKGDVVKERALFSSILNLLSNQNEDEDIQILLKILMWIMYCTSPKKKHYVIFDNIEQYIKLNKSKIQIPNSDISHIYISINNVVANIIKSFDRIKEDLGWTAFKIILSLRRTSIGFLDPALLHSVAKIEKNILDVTGYIQIADIWREKKRHLWEPYLKYQYEGEENKDIIRIADFVMNDGDQAMGTDYQSIISPLMSYGIRRNGRSQAHSIYATYEMLTNKATKTINQEEFYQLMKTPSNHSSRYMFRRSLLEFQFKWAIANENQERWKKINIGHLSGSRQHGRLPVEDVAYNSPQNVTLMRRILTYLSHFPDKTDRHDANQCKTVSEMFSTRSLYDLINGVLVNPRGVEQTSRDDFLQLATVLIALGDMSNEDTRSAPYVILNVNDNHFHANPEELVFADLLNTIWKEGYEKSLLGQKYNCGEYGVRITDAGYTFLLDWHASYSFMAALHCFAIPPLFFLKDPTSIQYVLKTVYEASYKLCGMYETEAGRFCGKEISLKTGTYLPKYGERYVTFKQRVKGLHIDHLNLYRDYIRKNYKMLSLSKQDMLDIVSQISRYIGMYYSWKTEEGALECF